LIDSVFDTKMSKQPKSFSPDMLRRYIQPHYPKALTPEDAQLEAQLRELTPNKPKTLEEAPTLSELVLRRAGLSIA
jgi:hypothetical protein